MPETLVIEEVESPRPGKGQVVVDVKACGVNFPDTLIIQGKYQFKPDLPFSAGSEVAGIVKEVGEGVKDISVGDHVIASTGWGGFAEEVVVDTDKIIPMPRGLDFTIASAFVLTYGTAYHALKDRAQIQPGETLLVLGAAGGVGIAAIEIGKHLGARVIAAASNDPKLEGCRQHGASEVINYASEDLRERIKQITAGQGIYVGFYPVSGRFFKTTLRRTSLEGGRLCNGLRGGG